MIKRDEWDFRDVVPDEVLPCAYWEYARESARIRAYYSREDSEFFPGPDIQPEIRRADGTLFLRARRPIADPLRMRFTEQIWSYALPLKTVHDKAFADGVGEDRLGYSWQQLPEAVRQAVVSELAPYFAEHPSLTFLPFNRCSDLRDINIADEDYRCAELDIETGIERLRVEISWADFTDKQILRAFKIWLKENRPRDFGRADRRG